MSDVISKRLYTIAFYMFFFVFAFDLIFANWMTYTLYRLSMCCTSLCGWCVALADCVYSLFKMWQCHTQRPIKPVTHIMQFDICHAVMIPIENTHFVAHY